jgi:hypothetical protein
MKTVICKFSNFHTTVGAAFRTMCYLYWKHQYGGQERLLPEECAVTGNELVTSQIFHEGMPTLNGLSFERGWSKSAENLGTSPFKRDVSNDTVFSQTHFAGHSI